MRDRILQLMKLKGMSQQEFSHATGLTPANVSSILTGRTSPTLKHAEALHRYFPNLNMAWLLFGDGEMMLTSTDDTQSESNAMGSANSASPMAPSDLFSQPASFPGAMESVPSSINPQQVTPGMQGISMQFLPQGQYPYIKNPDIKPRRIAEIRIFFDDGTFEVFPGNTPPEK